MSRGPKPGLMTILCVDDDPEDVEIFCAAIKTVGDNYRCVFASNGCEALQLLESISPDFIFLDVNMPVMGGKETLQRIRSNRQLKTVPVCIHTTTVSSFEAGIFRTLGATYCLKKATTFNELCDSLRSILSNIIYFTANAAR